MEEISVELSVKEISVTPLVANFQGYMNSHLVCSDISVCNTLIIKNRIKQRIKQNKTKHKQKNKQGSVLSSLLRAVVLGFFVFVVFFFFF